MKREAAGSKMTKQPSSELFAANADNPLPPWTSQPTSAKFPAALTPPPSTITNAVPGGAMNRTACPFGKVEMGIPSWTMISDLGGVGGHA